jgi:hypothetical protein
VEHTATRIESGKFQITDEPTQSTSPTYKELNTLFKLLRGKGHKYEHYESSFEKTVRDALIDESITFLYEPLKFRIPKEDKIGTWEYTYTPDFLLNIRIEGKPVIIEAKGRKYFDENIFTKYPLFLEQYGKRFYFIIITDMPTENILEGVRKYSGDKKIADEIWDVSHIHQGVNWENFKQEESAFIKVKIEALIAKSDIHLLRLDAKRGGRKNKLMYDDVTP